MNINKSLTETASEFVFEIMKTKLPGNYVYHNYKHTVEVVEAIRKIGSKSGISEEDMEIVILAGWFHDAGFTVTKDNHEDASIEIAKTFLSENNYSPEKTEKVVGCINATRYPQAPTNLLEEIMCDADLFHLGTKDYSDKSHLLRVEWEKTEDKQYSEIEWLKINIDFLSSHKFYTKYAKKALDEFKSEVLIKLQKKYRKKLEEDANSDKQMQKLEMDKQKLEAKKEAAAKSERGIETMFRNTIRTHVEFSAMADNKANIMISINTLIIGAVVTILVRKLDSNPQLVIPTIMLLAVSLTCIVYAVLVTRPSLPSGKFTRDDIHQKKVNLLFFGNFYKMDLKDFDWGMKEMMNDKDYLYGSMIKDLYYLGMALGPKYNRLRLCYNIFMFGLIASVIAFVIAAMLDPVQGLDLLERFIVGLLVNWLSC
jgi:predicted metal-dependent HD superfamily phosphohydrolase